MDINAILAVKVKLGSSMYSFRQQTLLAILSQNLNFKGNWNMCSLSPHNQILLLTATTAFEIIFNAYTVIMQTTAYPVVVWGAI